jgi:uncharacterized protein (TIGR02996 family)
MDTEEALWAAVGSNPADSLPRLVLADWLEENAGGVNCPLCKGVEEFGRPCKVCRTTGRISDGRAETAAALRAIADRVPRKIGYEFDERGDTAWWWNALDEPVSFNEASRISSVMFSALTAGMKDIIRPESWRHYPTASAAIRDLCSAWVKVHKMEVQS